MCITTRQLVIPARRVHEVPTHTDGISELIEKLGNGPPDAKTVREHILTTTTEFECMYILYSYMYIPLQKWPSPW